MRSSDHGTGQFPLRESMRRHEGNGTVPRKISRRMQGTSFNSSYHLLPFTLRNELRALDRTFGPGTLSAFDSV